MELNESLIDEFKDYVVQTTNDDVYYQLKDWLNQQVWLEEDQDYIEAMDYFIANLRGSLQWSD